MAVDPEAAMDILWNEYSLIFRELDDLTLGRWMAQTLGQLEGRIWRLSHPLVGSYRLAAQVAHERQTWFKRLASLPHGYVEAPCCRAPMLPLLTREVHEAGLLCLHCDETLVSVEDLPEPLKIQLKVWGSEYGVVHAIAHWDDKKRKSCDYQRTFETAAQKVEGFLARAGAELAPQLLDYYAAIVWEDRDDCLEVRPEDVRLG